jgi:ketosteroid isomerase-like protein
MPLDGITGGLIVNTLVECSGPAGRGAIVTNADVVRRFEDAFKNEGNLGIVGELMDDDFVHHLPYPGLPDGRAGMRAVGELFFGAIRDIRVSVDLVVSEGDLVADRVSASGTVVATGAPIEWVENHIYRVRDGRIAELWPAGGPDLG